MHKSVDMQKGKMNVGWCAWESCESESIWVHALQPVNENLGSWWCYSGNPIFVGAPHWLWWTLQINIQAPASWWRMILKRWHMILSRFELTLSQKIQERTPSSKVFAEYSSTILICGRLHLSYLENLYTSVGDRKMNLPVVGTSRLYLTAGEESR